ncbi:uncharacterized protein LOC106092953 isoform X1 [Stomoxys calcitrans]|uniref:Uncharacterized protein n=2 Tax=Stomoxys calcitrans TaxID=35570 RepID=A0A1I8Q879_STOCA|nr:uncharacterized protein LOC106092953 isoform X1 [Stomoxys calcitrans]
MTSFKIIMLLAAMLGLACGSPGGFFGKHEHHTIHVPYKVHTVHHHHVQKVPVIKEVVKEVPVEKLVIKQVVKEVPVEKIVHVPVEKVVHVPVHVPIHVHHESHGHGHGHGGYGGDHSSEYLVSSSDYHKGWSSSGW